MKKILSYIIYWLIQCTWGVIMTATGAIVALALLVTGHKPKMLGPNVYFTVGHNWGGASIGPFIVCCEEISEKTLYHECGHALQNMVFGPLTPFLISLPSAIRYWLRQCPTRRKKSLFNLFFLVGSLLLTTGLACLTGLVFHTKWLTILIESFRIYFSLVSIWLSTFEIPKYDKGYVDYDDAWFEGQATNWGTKIYKKKED